MKCKSIYTVILTDDKRNEKNQTSFLKLRFILTLVKHWSKITSVFPVCKDNRN